MIVPAVLTLATLGGLYYSRQPAKELTQNRNYRFAIVTLPAQLEADPRRAAAGTPEALVKATVEQMGFTGVKNVRTEKKGDATWYWLDGRWSLPQTSIPAPPVNWIAGGAFYPKYLGVV